MARSFSWLGWILAPIGLFVAAILGSWVFLDITRQVLHPNPPAITSVTHVGPPAEWAESVARARRIIRDSLAEQNLPGMSVAVGVGGNIVWSEGFGWADLETFAPVTPDTQFRIGTASTVLTSAAVGLLLEQGRLALDDEIQTYVPQFPKKQWPVTLRQLMAHVGGVGTDDSDEESLFRHRCEQPVEALQYFANNPLQFEPDTQYKHSKYGWILVSAAVEAAGGQPFLTFLREQIFQPLRMEKTGADSATEENPERLGEPEEDPPIFSLIQDVILKPLGIVAGKTPSADNRVTAYSAGFGPNPVFRYGLHEMRLSNLSCYAGSMAFLSTPSDLVRFGLALNDGTLLQPTTVRLLQSPQQLKSGQETGYGLDWDLTTVTLAGQQTQAVSHDGELLGQKAVTLMMFPDAGFVVAVASNISYADTSALALNIAEIFAQSAR